MASRRLRLMRPCWSMSVTLTTVSYTHLESPVNLECRVTQVIPLGSHDLFLAEVAACDVDESLLDENGKLCLDKARLIVYSHGEYLALGKKLGTFGYSVRKKKPVRRPRR